MGVGRDQERLRQFDARVVSAVAPVRILSTLEWPREIEVEFLERWRRGAPALPRVETPRVDLKDSRAELAAVLRDLDDEDPVERLLISTARSYVVACRMLEAAGTSEFTRMSTRLYGRPGRRIPGASVTSLDAAAHFTRTADRFPPDLQLPDEECHVPAEEVRDFLLQEIPRVLVDDEVAVELDPQMASKAAAGSRRVRLRSDACFSVYDGPQLLQHEILVHSLTAINGRRQPVLTCLGVGAPRTTAAQEGLATFAELVTGTIDVARFKRIALRVLAVDLALDGADFLEVFRFFLAEGQSETESFRSTQRLFRGGDVRGGGVVFTKDGVYMEGLLTVYAFFQWCLKNRRLDLGELLFAGRMAIADVFTLDGVREEGLVVSPHYLPPWYARTFSLVAFLAFSDFAHGFDLDALECPEARRLFRRAPFVDSMERFPALSEES